MFRKSAKYIIFSIVLLQFGALCAQNDQGVLPHSIDSAMAISPRYMPVNYTTIDPFFFLPSNYTDIDTAIDQAHYYSPLYDLDHIYQNLGLPVQAQQNMAFDFIYNRGFSYLHTPYPLYFTQQKDLRFYDLKTSYTRLSYSLGIPKNNNFDVTHVQRIKKVFAAVNLRANTNPGQYVNQKTNYLSIDGTVQYEIPSKIYGFKLSYIFDRVALSENGGLIANDESGSNVLGYNSFLQHISSTLKEYAVNTTDASSKTLSHDLVLQQYVNIMNKERDRQFGTITHTFQFKDFRSSYTDTKIDSLAFDTLYFSKKGTNDTLKYYTITNALQWSNFSLLEKMNTDERFFHYAAGIMHDYAYSKFSRYSTNSLSLFARTQFRPLPLLDIKAHFSYSIAGYNHNDMNADVEVSWAFNRKKAHSVGLEVNYNHIAPDYLFTHYSGNYDQWDKEWGKQDILKLGVFWTREKLKVSFNYFMLNDYMIFNKDLKPFCVENPANIAQLNVYTPLRFKNFAVNTNLYLQYSDNEYISVPIFAGKVSTYYIFHIFKRKLQLQIGLDLMYNTSYYADGYSPVLRQFYHQDDVKTGNYLYLGANLNLKIERINIFFRGGNLLAGLMSYNYFTTPYYPMEAYKFTLGISWRFYD